MRSWHNWSIKENVYSEVNFVASVLAVGTAAGGIIFRIIGAANTSGRSDNTFALHVPPLNNVASSLVIYFCIFFIITKYGLLRMG
jgi:hypothetical protein